MSENFILHLMVENDVSEITITGASVDAGAGSDDVSHGDSLLLQKPEDLILSFQFHLEANREERPKLVPSPSIRKIDLMGKDRIACVPIGEFSDGKAADQHGFRISGDEDAVWVGFHEGIDFNPSP